MPNRPKKNGVVPTSLFMRMFIHPFQGESGRSVHPEIECFFFCGVRDGKVVYGRMGGWVDGWMHGWMDAWMRGRMDGCVGWMRVDVRMFVIRGVAKKKSYLPKETILIPFLPSRRTPLFYVCRRRRRRCHRRCRRRRGRRPSSCRRPMTTPFIDYQLSYSPSYITVFTSSLIDGIDQR